MTGVLNAVVAPSVERQVITVANLGLNQYGISTGAVAITMRGATLFYIDYLTSSGLIRLNLAPELPQSFFRRIVIEDGVANTYQMFESSATSFFQAAGGVTSWHWNAASLWGGGDVGETKRIIFYF